MRVRYHGHGKRCFAKFTDPLLLLYRFCFDFVCKAVAKRRKLHGAYIALAAMANGNSTVFNFFVADNEHIRRLLKLRLTYFISDFFGAIVNLYADTVFLSSASISCALSA